MPVKEGATPDKGVQAKAEEREKYSALKESQSTSHTGRGYNSNGEPELYPSDIESYCTQYGISTSEAEAVWTRTVLGGEDEKSVVDEIIAGRVVYRQRFEQVHNSPDHALTAVQIAAARQEADRRAFEAKRKEQAENLTAPTPDHTQPEAGPHGPHADYHDVTLSTEEVAHAVDLTTEQVKQVKEGK